MTSHSYVHVQLNVYLTLPINMTNYLTTCSFLTGIAGLGMGVTSIWLTATDNVLFNNFYNSKQSMYLAHNFGTCIESLCTETYSNVQYQNAKKELNSTCLV